MPDLLRAALLDESSLVRQQAVLSLGNAGGPRDRGASSCPLLDDPDPKMRFVTLRALGQLRNPDAVPRLLPLPGRRAQGAALRRGGGAGRHPRRRGRAPAHGRARRPRPQPAARGRGEPGRDRRPAGGAAAAAGPRGRALERALRGGHRARAHPQRQGHARAAGARCGTTTRRCAAPRWPRWARSATRAPPAAWCELLPDPGLQRRPRRPAPDGPRWPCPRWSARSPASGPEARRLLVDLPGKLEDRRARQLLLAALADDSAVGARRGRARPGRRRLPGGGAAAHGPEGVGPLSGGAPGRRRGPAQAGPALAAMTETRAGVQGGAAQHPLAS